MLKAKMYATQLNSFFFVASHFIVPFCKGTLHLFQTSGDAERSRRVRRDNGQELDHRFGVGTATALAVSTEVIPSSASWAAKQRAAKK